MGNADPRAILIAHAALAAVEFVGMPEGRIPLAQAATYIAAAPNPTPPTSRLTKRWLKWKTEGPGKSQTISKTQIRTVSVWAMEKGISIRTIFPGHHVAAGILAGPGQAL